jgi:hypothetical protein
VGYIVYHCYLRFVRGVVYVGMMGYIVPYQHKSLL